MLSAYHNGEMEDLVFLPDYNVYLAIDYDGTNVYDPYENLLGHFETAEEARRIIAEEMGGKK